MKKKLIVGAMLLAFASPMMSFAQVSNNTGQVESGTQVAIVSDIMKDVVKRSLYKFGTQMLEKYMNPDSYNYNYNYNSGYDYNYDNNSSSSSTDYNNNQQYTSDYSQQDTTPEYYPGHNGEEMIPVS